jgi:hypothetical protein
MSGREGDRLQAARQRNEKTRERNVYEYCNI